MKWPRVTILLTSVFIGCRPEAQPAANAAKPDAATAAGPTVQPPGSLFVDLDSALASFRATLSAIAPALRPDSGTPRADSTYMQLRDTFRGSLRILNRVAADHNLEGLFHVTFLSQARRAAYLKAHNLPDDSTARVLGDSIVTFLRAHAVWSHLGEGGPSFTVSEQSVGDSVGRFLTAAGHAYQHFVTLEQTRPSAADASRMIPWDEFGDRLAATDGFVSAYPASPFYGAMLDARDRFLRFYLRGSDSFDGPVPTLTFVARTNMDRFLARHGSTHAASLVRGYLDAIAAQGYRGGTTLSEYLSALAQHPR